MANNEEVVLNNYADDSQIKKYINEVLAPKVFHDIPLNVLNTGHFSLVNEYMSQAIEQMAFTSSFYFNESFITTAVLPDSIYAEAAIFNIGYSFATPASSNFLLEVIILDFLRTPYFLPSFSPSCFKRTAKSISSRLTSVSSKPSSRSKCRFRHQNIPHISGAFCFIIIGVTFIATYIAETAMPSEYLSNVEIVPPPMYSFERSIL